MLEKIKIKNFQSHVDTEMTLDPGINAITGSSDVGKSSIFRAINWLWLNRPIGSAFINNSANGKPAEVSLKLDGTVITRTKSKSRNEYHLDEKAFKVVSSNVPEEITALLNLNDISVQGQHDAYFLLQSSPGEVAKKLNKVAGFEIIDAITKSVKSTITKNTTDSNYTQEHNKELENAIEKYEHLDDVEKQLRSIQTDTNKYDTTKKTYTNIATILDDINDVSGALETLDDWLGIESFINPIFVDASTMHDKSENATHLEQIITAIKASKKRISGFRIKALREKDVEQILTDTEKVNTQYRALESLVLALKSIKEYHTIIKVLTLKILDLENRMNVLLKDQKLCPLCGVELTDARIKHIQHWG